MSKKEVEKRVSELEAHSLGRKVPSVKIELSCTGSDKNGCCPLGCAWRTESCPVAGEKSVQ